ncbi:MAG: alpha/beta fold hydrolase [Kiloniellales bacterium]|nr:alpha/beta fold hydrolase [Kiloniellales bacterium]
MERRSFLQAGMAGGVVGAVALANTEPGHTHDGAKATFVFAHGSWHGAWCWAEVVPDLVAAGHGAIPLDLPGHGLDAKFPPSYFKRPLDMEAFAAEKSHMADISLDAFTDAVVAGVEQAKAGGAERVIVVGHSMGGVPITFAGEKAADSIETLVFVTACMMPPGKPYSEYFAVPTQSDAKLGPVLIGDPGATGGLRWDPRSTDADYLAAARAALAHDVDDEMLQAAMNMLTPDAPISMYSEVPNLTKERYGSLKRAYVKCTQDWTIRPGTQDLMIEEMDTAFPENKTMVYELSSSHEPMLSQPKALASVLLKIAG